MSMEIVKGLSVKKCGGRKLTLPSAAEGVCSEERERSDTERSHGE
jgi:hypothetical protein